MNANEILPYCQNRLVELDRVIMNPDPWGFVCIAAYIDFLSKLAEGCDQGGSGYKSLIEVYYPDAYRNFRYTNDPTDRLYYQMYHVFRCGILHGFTLFPDVNKYTQPNVRFQGRPRSVLLTHDGLDGVGHKYNHLDPYVCPSDNIDAAVLIATDLLHDTRIATQDLLSSDATRQTAARWVSVCPPIGFKCY